MDSASGWLASYTNRVLQAAPEQLQLAGLGDSKAKLGGNNVNNGV